MVLHCNIEASASLFVHQRNNDTINTKKKKITIYIILKLVVRRSQERLRTNRTTVIIFAVDAQTSFYF